MACPTWLSQLAEWLVLTHGLPLLLTQVVDACQVSMCDPQRNGTGLLLERCNYTKIVGGEVSDCSQYGICLRGPSSLDQRCTGVKIIGVTGGPPACLRVWLSGCLPCCLAVTVTPA